MHAFAIAVMSGMASAFVTQVALARYGIEISGVWRSLLNADRTQFGAALAWWTTAGAAFVGGFAVAFVMTQVSWLYLRFLRGWLLAALVIGLASLARELPPPHGLSIGYSVVSGVASLIVAFLMASFGAHFALRR